MKKLLPLLLILSIWSCGTPKDDGSAYWVNSFTAPCENNPLLQCLLIQKNETIDPNGWENFSGSIEGFVFEPEYMVKLKVKESVSVNDGNTKTELELIEVISKERDPRFNLKDMWVAISIDGAPFDVPDDEEAPYFEVNLRAKSISGNNGCNTFNGDIETLTANSIKLGNVMSTMKACPNLDYPDRFTDAFQSSDNYRIENGILIMSEGETEKLRFKKVN